MLVYEFLLAAALLLQSPDVPTTIEPDLFGVPAMQLLALEWEILDPRELRHVLSRPEDFDADLAMLQRRAGELAAAPLAGDAERFPTRETINEYLAFNRAYRRQLDNRQTSEPARWWDLNEALNETDRLYELWDTVRDARCEYYYVTVKRHALQRVRALVGAEAYYAGRLPAWVPVWRFGRAD